MMNINAKKAKELSDKYATYIPEKTLKIIEDSILFAASKGHYYVTLSQSSLDKLSQFYIKNEECLPSVNTPLQTAVINLLKENGFTTEYVYVNTFPDSHDDIAIVKYSLKVYW